MSEILVRGCIDARCLPQRSREGPRLVGVVMQAEIKPDEPVPVVLGLGRVTEDSKSMVVSGKTSLCNLVAYLLQSDRTLPVIGLAPSLNGNEPVLAPSDVHAMVGLAPRVYFIPQELELRSLRGMRGPLALSRGEARIWWPGLSEDSDPEDHPSIIELPDIEGTLGEFGRQFDLSRPHVREEIKLLDGQRRLAEYHHAHVIVRNREVAERLRDAQIERHEALTRAQEADASLRAVRDQLSEMSCEERLQTLIPQEWKAATSRDDRRAQPLRGYVLTQEFIAMVERQDELPLEKLAWVCAMVACGYAPTRVRFDPHPLVEAPGGAQVEREDGAKGWRCNLERNAGGPRLLHYWIRKDGIVEFAGVGNDDQLGTG